MREIKFRAWDGEQMSNFALEIDTSGYLARPPIPADGKPFLLLLQFTGLHDKNGKEIYEGDVLDVQMDRPRGKAVVEWADGGFIIRTEYGMRADICIVLDNLMEVIDNIYENADLLK